MIMMDYLPIQATSVPCEHVFLSAKETDTAKRNRISLVLMEALQLLKFLLKKECLNFTRGWLTSEAAMSILMPRHNLSSLTGDDPEAVLDNMLKELSIYDGKAGGL
jgi:hypothetical protein